LSNVALDPIPQWPQRPEPGSNRAGSPSTDTSPNRFDALLDDTSSDARPAPSEHYDRSRAPDRRDDTRADDRAATRARGRDARAQDARAADRQQAADDRSTARAADDAKAQQDSDKVVTAKDQTGAGSSDPTQAKAKPVAAPADAIQAPDKPAAKASDTGQVTGTEAPAQPADAAAAEAQAKAAAGKAAAVIGDAVATDKKTDKAAEPDKDTTATATATPDPNAAPVQVPVVAVPVAPLPTIDPSVGAASTTNAAGTAQDSPTVDAATALGSAPQAAEAEAAKQTTTAASGESTDAKTADPAQQTSFKALAEAAGAKPQADTDAKVDLAGKPKGAQPASARAKTAAAADPAPSTASDGARTVDISVDTPIVPVARTLHLVPISAEHTATRTYPGASEARADAVTATAAAQAGSNAPILPLNLAQSIALPLSTMFQVAAPRADAAVDAAVPVAGLAIEIVSRAQEGGKRFDIRLDPPELGRVDVRLNVDDNGKVTSHLVVERSETLDLLRRDQPQLERALQQAGLNTDGGLQFSLRDQNSAQRDQTPRDGRANTSQLIVPDDETAAAEAARRGYGRLLGRAGGVDIRI
jgi:flagellar hook-length control protein FliK